MFAPLSPLVLILFRLIFSSFQIPRLLTKTEQCRAQSMSAPQSGCGNWRHRMCRWVQCLCHRRASMWRELQQPTAGPWARYVQVGSRIRRASHRWSRAIRRRPPPSPPRPLRTAIMRQPLSTALRRPAKPHRHLQLPVRRRQSPRLQPQQRLVLLRPPLLAVMCDRRCWCGRQVKI